MELEDPIRALTNGTREPTTATPGNYIATNPGDATQPATSATVVTSPFLYFEKFATDVTLQNRKEVPDSILELETFTHMIKLLEAQVTMNKDKTYVTIVCGDLITSLFYMAVKNGYTPCNSQTEIDPVNDPVGGRKTIMERFIKCVKCFLLHYQKLKSSRIKGMTAKKDLAAWSDRICHILVQIANVTDLHTLFLCRIQKNQEIDNVICDRDIYIQNFPPLENKLMAINLFPIKYNLQKLTWPQIVEFLTFCNIDMTMKQVKLEFLAESILNKTLNSKKYEKDTQKTKWLAQKLFCNQNLIDLTSSKSLWYPLSRWLAIDTFEAICITNYPEAVNWFTF